MNASNTTTQPSPSAPALRTTNSSSFRSGGAAQFISMPEDQAAALRTAMQAAPSAGSVPAPADTPAQPTRPQPIIQPHAPIQTTTVQLPAKPRTAPQPVTQQPVPQPTPIASAPNPQPTPVRTPIAPIAPVQPKVEHSAHTPVRIAHRTGTAPVIAITSGKGGVGKTNTAVNLAVTLAACGLKASLVDADLGLANADVLCGITPTTRLDSVLNKSSPSRAANRGLDAIAIDAPGGFKLVPGAVGVRRMTSLAPSERVQLIESLDALDAASDVILVDTGAGISDGVTDFVQASDLAIVVLTPEPTSIADAYAIIKACFAPHLRRDDERSPVLSVIVNQARSRDEGLAVYQRLSNTCERFLGIRPILLGTLPIDPALPAAVRRRVPVCLASPSAPISHELGRVAGEVAKLCGLSTTKTRVNPASARRWWSKLLGRA